MTKIDYDEVIENILENLLTKLTNRHCLLCSVVLRLFFTVDKSVRYSLYFIVYKYSKAAYLKYVLIELHQLCYACLYMPYTFTRI